MAAFAVTIICWLRHCVPLHPPVIVKLIFAVPAPTAVTTPVEGSTVATPVLSLLHTPVPPPSTTPVVVYVGVAPIHTGLVPLTELMAAFAVTIICWLADTGPLHPPVIVKLIFAVPAPT